MSDVYSSACYQNPVSYHTATGFFIGLHSYLARPLDMMRFGPLVLLLPVLSCRVLSAPTDQQEIIKSNQRDTVVGDNVFPWTRNALSRRSGISASHNSNSASADYGDLMEYFRQLEARKDYEVNHANRIGTRVYIIGVRDRYTPIWVEPVFPPGQEDEAAAFRSCQAVMVMIIIRSLISCFIYAAGQTLTSNAWATLGK